MKGTVNILRYLSFAMVDISNGIEADITLRKQRRALTDKVTTEDARICNLRMDLKACSLAGGGPDISV